MIKTSRCQWSIGTIVLSIDCISSMEWIKSSFLEFIDCLSQISIIDSFTGFISETFVYYSLANQSVRRYEWDTIDPPLFHFSSHLRNGFHYVSNRCRSQTSLKDKSWMHLLERYADLLRFAHHWLIIVRSTLRHEETSSMIEHFSIESNYEVSFVLLRKNFRFLPD